MKKRVVRKIYDKKNNRLMFFLEKATPEFWDRHWREESDMNPDLQTVKSTWASRIVEKYIKSYEGVILEGGCGRAEHVAALVNAGYRVIGIDFAENTVKWANKSFPMLDIRRADVRNMPFEDNTFTGYLSLGVIEHFWEGYDVIVDEMRRVIRRGGYLFLTFPYMSPIRKVKALLRMYDRTEDDHLSDDFYQFALDHKSVIRRFRKKGFRLVEERPFDHGSGVKQEFSEKKAKFFNKLFRYGGKNLFVRMFRKLSFLIIKNLANHVVLLVFVKQ